MTARISSLPLADTKAFSLLMQDYASGDDFLKSFITEFPSPEAVRNQTESRQFPPTHREVLVNVLQEQYRDLPQIAAVQEQLEKLKLANTFTVCTAHQPSVFTGHLYFIYKTLHAIKLAQELNLADGANCYVPVFYVGSEDNDLEEIGELNLEGRSLSWSTSQRGACGRMRTTDMEEMLLAVNALLDTQLAHEKELKDLFATAYDGRHTLAEATRIVLHGLFGRYGLVVLDADDARLKQLFVPVMQEELWHQSSFPIVSRTLENLSVRYKAQASPRLLNLFYLRDQLRERLEKTGDVWKVVNTDIEFNAGELHEELSTHPERFSPNVILRPLYQESILPNVLFVGGGGEMAYWMQLKELFLHHGIPYPVLQLRQSFMWIAARTQHAIEQYGLSDRELFLSAEDYLKMHLKEDERLRELQQLQGEVSILLDRVSTLSATVSPNLHRSAEAHHTGIRHLQQRVVQKFMSHLRREDNDRMQGFLSVKDHLFPAGRLQERHENLLMLVKSAGPDWRDILLQAMPGFGKELIILHQGG